MNAKNKEDERVKDLFAEEQRILDDGLFHLAEVRTGKTFDLDKYAMLLDEYRKLLRQFRRATRIADRTAIDLHESNQDLTNKVNYDALTGIYNRRYMEDNLSRILKSIARHGGTLSVLMIDVDFFKKYNDTYGHNKGDECLKSVAETLAGVPSRPDDFAARYGGEVFTIVLPNTDEIGAKHIADRILKNIRERKIPHGENEAANCVTVSIGVTTGSVEQSHTVEDYIKRADEALYRSKQNGRNQYTYVDFKEGK